MDKELKVNFIELVQTLAKLSEKFVSIDNELSEITLIVKGDIVKERPSLVQRVVEVETSFKEVKRSFQLVQKDVDSIEKRFTSNGLDLKNITKLLTETEAKLVSLNHLDDRLSTVEDFIKDFNKNFKLFSAIISGFVVFLSLIMPIVVKVYFK